MTVAEGPAQADDEQRPRRFVFRDGDQVAELTYRMDGDRLILVHTGVPPGLSGRGIGGRLVRAAVERAIADGLTVVPLCSFARKWLADRPDVARTVTIDWAVPGRP